MGQMNILMVDEKYIDILNDIKMKEINDRLEPYTGEDNR